MNLRTRTTALVAALALSLTLTGGIASASVPISATTGTTLGANPGSCTIVVGLSQNINFGSYTWDGTAYVGNAGSGEITAALQHTGAPGQRHCAPIQVTGTDLILGTDVAFTASQINVGLAHGLDSNTSKDANEATTIPSNGTQSVPVSLTASVTGVPSNLAPVGSYTGSITLTVVTAQ